MTRTPTAPLNDKKMWRKALAKAHPDAGGDHNLFIWMQAARDAMCDGGANQTTPPPPRREPPQSPQDEHREDHKESVPFDASTPFDVLTRRALKLADDFVEPLYADLLRLLEDCEEAHTGALKRQQERGATYRQLAAAGHAAGMSTGQRVRWYHIAEDIPLSRRHVGHILSRLKRSAA